MFLANSPVVCTCLVRAFPQSALDPHTSPPTEGRWQHVKRVSVVGLMYSTLKLKMLWDFSFNHKTVKSATISWSLSWLV